MAEGRLVDGKPLNSGIRRRGVTAAAGRSLEPHVLVATACSASRWCPLCEPGVGSASGESVRNVHRGPARSTGLSERSRRSTPGPRGRGAVCPLSRRRCIPPKANDEGHQSL